MAAQQEPCERYANEEQERADNVAQRISEISGNSGFTIGYYQAAYRDASETAAAHTAQPTDRP